MDNGNEKTNISLSQQGLGNLANGGSNKKILIIVIVAVGLIIGLLIWKSIQINTIRQQAATEMQQLHDLALRQIRQSDELHLRSLSKPFVWAVRTEMLKNNISQVNLYTNEMVKEKNFQKIVVVDNNGMVIVSTNKKEEGKEFISIVKPDYLASDTTTIENINDSLMIMSSPVMGFNNRLGTLVISYSVQHQSLQ